MSISGKIKKLFSAGNSHYAKSFSQTGEDRIVSFIFDQIGIKNPSYIDIGAHDPFYINNTALFYSNSSRGINIEPDPELFKKFLHHRKNDINLNIGISDKSEKLPFYIMDARTLNTFSKKEVEYLTSIGHSIVDSIDIEVHPLEYIIDRYANNIFPDFATIDAEGIDSIIVKSLIKMASKPKVICVETIPYANTGIAPKNNQLIQDLIDIGYFLFADTYINSIFVKKELFENR